MTDQKTVAVCDDDKTMVFIVRTILTKKNFRVFTAENGNDAIKLIKSAKPQLVLLDLDMPQKNGLEVLEALRGQDTGKNYKIVISAHEDKVSRDRALALGADDFWMKPFNAAKLLSEIDTLIQQGRV
jgi:DNA-binding response OmpR family regulator